MSNTRQKQKQGDESIHHFSHKHELFFYYYIENAYTRPCVVCRSKISTNEEYLSCERCEFQMHKSCAELPQKLKHPFHQQHSLTLLDEPPRRKGENFVICCACEEKCFVGFVYECSECEFYIDTKCAMLFPTTRLPAKHQKLLHPHPLIVCERKIVERNIVDFKCGGCLKSFDDDQGEVDYSTPICVCLECHLLLHESCANLPQNITQHLLHPDCTLTIRISSKHDENHNYPSGRCDFCGERYGLYFQCSDCSIKMDIPCALLTPSTTTNYKPVGEQKDNGHPHPLIHCNIPVNRYYGLRKCGGCNQHLEKSAYYCISCKLWLHESCAHLPRQIQHPFHPLHPLTLSDPRAKYSDFRCKACWEYDQSSSFSYRCDLCDFVLHLSCASPILYPMIYMPELHQHPLAYSDIICRWTSYSCSKCTRKVHTAFRCMQCHFFVHDHCLPLLPTTVKTKWHRHPLILTHGPIKGDPDEGESDIGDSDEGEKVDVYCDGCEEKRDLEDPTYYCAKCHLISHVHCVMWEVMDYLQGKSTKVGELCNTKVILIGEDKVASGNKDRVEQGDHQGIMDEDSDHILTGLRNEIAAVSAEVEEHKAKLEESSEKLQRLKVRLGERLSERRSEILSQHISYNIEFK